jgi:hypothetical protein
MEAAKRLIIVLILVLLASNPAWPQEKPAAGSGSRMASCVVRVTSDPAVLPLSFQTVRELLHSSGVFGKAARDVLGLPQEESLGLFDIEPLSGEFIGSPTSQPSMGPAIPEGFGYEQPPIDQAMDIVTSSNTNPPPLPGSVPPEPLSPRIRGTRRATPVPSLAPFAERTFVFLLKVDFRQVDAGGTGRAVRPVAEEFMNALITNLCNALTNAFDEHAGRLRGQLQLAEEEAARAEGDLRQKQDQLREISGSYVMDRDSILGEINNLRNEIQQIEMKQASDQVTVDTTSKRIAELQAAMQFEMQKDPITNELERLLAIQVENLHNVEKLSASGRTSATELADAQEKMARSRIELAQRREQLSKSKGGNQIESLNNALTNLSMGVAQYRAQLAGYQQQLAHAEALLGKADEYELLSLKADVARQSLQETIVWRDRMSRRIRLIQPPEVSVIGGN